ncbi:MAG: NAD(+) synthase [Gemmatimonadota bacterium]
MTPKRDPREPREVRARLVAWIADRVRESGSDGAVFGLSGGVDSAVVCGLAAEALGAERCLGVILPIESAPDDARLAREVARKFGVATAEVRLEDAFDALLDALRWAASGADLPPAGAERERLARMNVKPRLRMASLYYFANTLGRLVVGTGNAAEFAVGYFTKYGDGGADIFPLADLVKSEVWALARELGVPAEIIERPPTAGLEPGQTDEGEMGITYERLDAFLLRGTSGDAAVDELIRGRIAASRHKVEPAPLARLD